MIGKFRSPAVAAATIAACRNASGASSPILTPINAAVDVQSLSQQAIGSESVTIAFDPPPRHGDRHEKPSWPVRPSADLPRPGISSLSDHAIVIVAGVVVVGALIGLITNWIEKPPRLSGTVAVALLAIAVVVLVFLTLDQSGDLGNTPRNAATPHVTPSVTATPSRSPQTRRAPRPHKHRIHSTGTGQSSHKPQPPASHPPVDAANEVLSATMTPQEIHNDGKDVVVQVTVTNATPGGHVTWEEDTRGSGSYPGKTPCLINSPSSWCGMDLLHGVVTANSAGVATFDMTFIPGEIYDDLGLTSVSAFGNVVWEATVWDDATFNPHSQATADRSAGCAPGITTRSTAPPPSEWSRS